MDPDPDADGPTFFRDADALAGLAACVLPTLFEGRAADETVRVWVPGCATGEDAVSLAILLLEHREASNAACRIRIFATDTDAQALGIARAARYPEGGLEAVSAARRRFFVADAAGVAVAATVRDLCVFSPHDATRDPPFAGLDLIACRGLPTDPGAHDRVLQAFHDALRPEGFLFSGTANGPVPLARLFAPLDAERRIFRRRGPDGATHAPRVLAGPRSPWRSGDLDLSLRQSVEAQVVQRFAPPHVVIDRHGEVVHYSNRTGCYLEAAAGLPTRQILTLAREALRLDVRSAFREAVAGGTRAVRRRIAVEGDDGGVRAVTVTVEPLAPGRSEEPLYLVLFTDEGPAHGLAAAPTRAAAGPDVDVIRLELDLHETRGRLQSLIEEYDTALEELRSSNEELQSVNEELGLVNLELSGKVASLDRANTDLHNLFASADIATVFLDARLVIRSLTPAVTAIFGILPRDRGRPITDFAAHFALPDLADDVAAIMRGSDTIERQIDRPEDETRYLVRLAPYRSGQDRTEGVVVSFMDVTTLARAELRQRLLVSELQHRTRNLLAVVQSIARQTLGAGPAVDTYTERLKALGRVQGLFVRSERGAADVGDLVRLELQAHGAEETDRVAVSGPRADLGVDQVQTFALVLHELATNAVKHGALAQPGARLAITWWLDAGPDGRSRLGLRWVESGVAMPTGPERRGFGRDLIERALTYTLRARATFVLGPDGVACAIEMPL